MCSLAEVLMLMVGQIEDWKHLNFPVPLDEEQASKDSPKEFKEEEGMDEG